MADWLPVNVGNPFRHELIHTLNDFIHSFPLGKIAGVSVLYKANTPLESTVKKVELDESRALLSFWA